MNYPSLFMLLYVSVQTLGLGGVLLKFLRLRFVNFALNDSTLNLTIFYQFLLTR